MKNVLLILPVLVVAFVASARAQTSVTMWQADTSHTGVNSKETILTPGTVGAAGNFGLLFSRVVDGQIYGQPLILAGVTIGGTTHNVVFVATEHDSLYAFDADSNSGTNASALWHDSFIQSGVTQPVPQGVVGSSDISGELGITATPVIDASTKTIYTVSKIQKISDGSYHQYLHALDATTGAEKFGGPVEINPSWAGSANYNGTEQTTEGVVPFSALHEHLRSAMALYNGVVYLAYASHSDTQPYHGELIGYNASTLALTKKFITTPNGIEGGIWGGGASPAFDSSGNVYFAVGNGSFDHAASTYTTDADWGESMLKLSTSGTFDVAYSNTLNWFTPNIYQSLNNNDLDLGSSGLLLLPDQTAGPHTHIVVGGGKGGIMYVVDRDSMGGVNTPDATIQQFATPGGQYLFVTPSYFNGHIYYASSGGPMEERTVGYDATTGNYISPTSTKSSQIFNGKGSGCFITANGTSNGIVWALTGSSLLAYNAADISQAPIAQVAATTQDSVSTQTPKFGVPSAANGKVYFTGYKELGGSSSSGYLFVCGVFSTSAGTPSTPGNAAAAAITASQATVTWSDSSNNETGFVIERSTVTTGPFTQVGTTAAGVTTYTDTGLSANTTYYYLVFAQNANGLSSASNVATTTTFPTYQASGLVAYWPLDDASTSGTAADVTGNGHTGTVNGEAVFADGLINNGIELHGTGFATSNISVPNSSALQFGSTASFTLAAWVLPDNVDGVEQAIIAKSADQGNRYGLYINAGKNFVARGPGGDLVGTAATTGTWTHVTLVQDGSANTRKLYINGVLKATGTAQAADGAGAFWIGQQNISSTPDSFPGVVDEVRVYNRALAASEVPNLMSAPVLQATSVVTQGGTKYGLVFAPVATLIAEPRQGSPGGTYNLVLNFSAPVSGLTASLTKQGGAAATGSVSSIGYGSGGKVVTVVLKSVANIQALDLHLAGFATTGGTADVLFNVLVGDVNTDNVVDYLDAAIIANGQSPSVNATTYLNDVNCDGVVNSTDSILVNGAVGTSLGTELDANLAIYQPSSDLNSLSPNASAFAFDNDVDTRWESYHGVDPGWVEVDLGSVSKIHSIALNWEAAADYNYQLQSSTDTQNWTTLVTVSANTTSGIHTYSGLNGSGRYVRMYGTQRDSVYGYSLWDMKVNGIPGSIVANPAPSITGDLSISGTQGTPLTYAVTASNTPTGFSATNLPAGLTINTTSGLISGAPSGSGSFTAYVTATNSKGTSASTPLAIVLASNSSAPSISSPTSASGTVDTAFNYQITATNSPTSFAATNLPAGLSVNTSTGLISGTPSAAVSATVTISAKNANGTGTGTVGITIVSSQQTTLAKPVINSAASASGAVGTAFNYKISATNSPTSYAAANLPAGLSVSTSTGTISGTPTTAGSKAVTISATNSGGTGTGTVTITINPAKPAITSGLGKTGTVGTAFSYQINAINDPTSFNATNLPAGLTVNAKTGAISGTPTKAGGPTAVTISATNAGGTGTATLSVTIDPATVSQPVITSATTTAGTVGVAFRFQVTGTNSPTSYSASNLPAGLTISTTTGLISGTPTTATSSPATPTISATNAGGTTSIFMKITIYAKTDTNVALQKTAVASSAQTDDPASFANDGNSATRWSASNGNFPQTWTVDLGATKTLSRVDIAWYSAASRQYQYTIATSTNNSTFTTVVNQSVNKFTGNTSDGIVGSGRYVKITITAAGSSGGWASFYECAVYGH